MHATIATLGLLATTGALAQSTSVTSWLNFAFDDEPVASVIAVNGDAVTYAIACDASIDADDCGLFPDMTITAGPSTVAYTYSMATDGVSSDEAEALSAYGNHMSYGCEISGTTQAVCHAKVSAKGAKYPVDTTTTLASEDMTFGPLTITAGLEKLKARAASTSASGAASTGASKASSGSGSATAKATSTAEKSGDSASASATASPSAGGAGHFAAPLLAVAGVAAAAFAL